MTDSPNRPLIAGISAGVLLLVAAGTMAVAYFQFHWKLQGGAKILPIANGGELAALYCFVFLFICIKGAGAASLDRLLRRS